MTSVTRQLATMRILAMPLTRTSPLTGKLTFYHFQTPPSTSTEPPGLFTRTMTKAGSIWAGMGKSPQGSWKYSIFTYGEKLLDRIPFEETSLKTFDLTLGPTIPIKKVSNDTKIIPVPLIYPSISTSPLQQLESMIALRIPKHRNGFFTWMIIAPLTLPFALIPFLPNLPLFFCVWRSWSHYRAYRSSEYIGALIERDLIVPESSPGLDEVYASCAPKEQDQQLVLQREAVPKVAELFSLSPNGVSELYRALEQTSQRLSKQK